MYQNFEQSAAKIKVCQCEQCKACRKKTTNRKLKRVIKRLLNKRRRKLTDKVINFYWA